MAQVSYRKIKSNTEQRIETVFLRALVDIKDEHEARLFFESFFTTTEKINLPKRLGIFILLYQGTSYLEISEQITVSVSTIGSVLKKLQIYPFEGLEKAIKKILDEKLPEKRVDPDPLLLRGKRVYRNKSVKMPYKEFPY